jgi:hypothetical protein
VIVAALVGLLPARLPVLRGRLGFVLVLIFHGEFTPLG